MQGNYLNIKENLSHSTLRGVLWLFSSAVAYSALKIVVIAVLARLLTPKDFGIIAAVSVVTGIAEIFSQMGIGPSLIQIKSLTRESIRTAFTLSILFGIAVGSLVMLAAPLVADFYRMPDLTNVIRVLAINFPLRGMSVVSESLLKRDLKFRVIVVADIWSLLIGYCLGSCILALAGFGFWALVLAILLSSFLRLISLARMQSHSWRLGLDRPTLTRLLATGTGFTTSTFFNYLALNGDNLVVGRCLGLNMLGIYSRSYNLMAQSVTLFGNVITSVLFPAMSSIQEETDRLRQAYLHAMSFVSVLMLPTSAIAFTLAHEIIITLLGSSWVDAVVPFRILALGMYFRVAYKISATLLSSTGAVYTHARREGVYAFLIILGSLICQRWGVGGVATAVLFALVSHFLLLSWAGLRHLSVTLREFLLFQAHGFCLGILAGLMTWGIASGLRHLLLPEAAVLVITLVILSIAASALLLWFPGPVAGEKNLWLVKKTLDLISTKGPRLSRVTSLMGRRLRIIRISRLGI